MELKISKEVIDHINSIISKYDHDNSRLIMMLHDVQQEYRYIPIVALKILSDELEVSLSSLRKTATFYDFFVEEPHGDVIIRVCHGASCVVSGSLELTKVLNKKFQINESKTSEDNKLTVDIIYCNGHCDKAPTIRLNDQLFTHVDQFELGAIVKEYVK
jgi:NADH:ubiquinone oxidoreductase subunit E